MPENIIIRHSDLGNNMFGKFIPQMGTIETCNTLRTQSEYSVHSAMEDHGYKSQNKPSHSIVRQLDIRANTDNQF